MLKTPLACLLAIALGLIAPFAFAPYQLWPLMIVAFVGLLALLKRSDAPFRVGFCFALSFYSSGLRWIHVSIYQFGGIPLLPSYLLVVLLAAYLALYPALACWMAHKWPKQANKGFLYLGFPASWLLGEWLRAHILTGFPWLMPGYSQVGAPLANYASLIGVYGVTLLILWCAAACYQLLSWRKGQSLQQAFIPILVLTVLFGLQIPLARHQFTQPHAPISVALVQGNEAISTKWAANNRMPTLNRYWRLTQAHPKADVVVWPESALPFTEYQAQEYLKYIDAQTSKRQQTLITGIIHQDRNSQDYYNALLVLGQKSRKNQPNKAYSYGDADRYYKRHLVPIGEYVPFESWLRPLAQLFNLPMSSLSSGSAHQRDIRVQGHHWLSAICYEIVFGTELRAMITPNTDTILTISDDTWFGRSIGPMQHLQIAQMRALELQRPVVRDTNTGMTALINVHGQITEQLPSFTTAVLTGSITPATGYTPYQRWGLLPLYLFVAAAWLGYLWQRKYQ
ncbi:apolipoprotein N-acyltransferase [Celerinatantimonas yamalensis]|uniref:Apolipoprotein N-acyltransferase n=1 Tax=Celerinatantimonas yamalensis TaxID=559956 RepID=A0ABW9G9I2_9GAMM